MGLSLLIVRSKPQNSSTGKQIVRSGEHGAALVLALLITGFLLLLGAAVLSIGSSERQVGLNDRGGTQALYLSEAGLERARRLLPGYPVNDVLSNNLLLGDWISGTPMGSGSYRAVISNNVMSIGHFGPDGGTVACGTTTCDTDRLVVIDGIGSFQGSLRLVRALVEVPPILSAPAPLTIVNTGVDPHFEGESFVISGFDRNLDGSSGSLPARPGLALVTSEAASVVQSALTAMQQDRVVGAGTTPSIEVVANAPTIDALQRLKLRLATQADRVLVNPGTVLEDLRREDGTGQLTVIKGDPSADSHHGLDTAGNATLDGSGSGSGVLVVTGQLSLRGSYRFDGLVLLVGDASRLTLEGDATIMGSVLIANRTGADPDRAALVVKDRAHLQLSQQALQEAGRLVGAALRTWQEISPD